MEVRDYSICLGINNVSHAVRLLNNQSKYELLDAVNVYVTDRGSLRKRNAFSSVYSGQTTLLYSFGNILYRVTGNTLYADNVAVMHLTTSRVAITDDGECLYLTDMAKTYKIFGTEYNVFLGKGGHDIAFCNGSLWLASGNLIYFTTPYRDKIDFVRCVYPFPSYITLMASVGNSLYVSDTERVYYVYPSSDASYSKRTVIEYPALKNSDVVIDGQIVSPKISGEVLLIATKNGLYACLATGDVANLTPQYSFSEGGTATFLHTQKLYVY